MLKRMKGCLGSVVTAAILVVVAFVGWRYGDRVFPTALRLTGFERLDPAAAPQPSEEIAAQAVLRYEALLRGPPGATARFSDLEVTSMLRYSFPGMIPPGISEPTVEISGGGVRLHARVARDAFPSFPNLEGVMEILPDTLPLEVDGVVLPFDERHVSVLVEGIDASSIPLPRRLVPGILNAVGRRDREGLPPNGVAIPLLEGLSGAYLNGDSLVLVSGG